MSFRDLLVLITKLQKDPRKNSRLEGLARSVGRTPSHFQRIFARSFGESAKKMGLRITLDRAAAELLATEKSVLEIALDGGFESHEGFSRAFKRRFAVSPKAYREKGFSVSGEPPAGRHYALVRSVSPCVRLFRRPLEHKTKTTERASRPLDKERNMQYTIEKKKRAPLHALVMRKRADSAQISQTLAEILPQVFEYAIGKGLPLGGQPFCRYRNWGPGGVTLEAGLPLTAAHQGEGEIIGLTYPEGPAASTVHIGPYESLGEAYKAIENWLESQGIEGADDPYEVYLTDPGEVPNPEEWQTEVIWPLKE